MPPKASKGKKAGAKAASKKGGKGARRELRPPLHCNSSPLRCRLKMHPSQLPPRKAARKLLNLRPWRSRSRKRTRRRRLRFGLRDLRFLSFPGQVEAKALGVETEEELTAKVRANKRKNAKKLGADAEAKHASPAKVRLRGIPSC